MSGSTTKVALVTGANQGIGFALVRRLCKEYPNWVVYGTSRSPANGEQAVQKLREEGLFAKFLCADVTDEKSFIAVREKLLAEHGGLDILVNNAGFAFKIAATEPYPVKVQVTLATNVFGTNTVCQQLFPILRDGARVVIVSSYAAFKGLNVIKSSNKSRYERYVRDPPLSLNEVLQEMRDYESAVKKGDFVEKGWPNDSAYWVSKTACTLMARAMNDEFNKKHPQRDIVVNAADPGSVSTSMNSDGQQTVEEGADTPFYLATLPSQTPIRGKHVSKRAVLPWE